MDANPTAVVIRDQNRSKVYIPVLTTRIGFSGKAAWAATLARVASSRAARRKGLRIVDEGEVGRCGRS